MQMNNNQIRPDQAFYSQANPKPSVSPDDRTFLQQKFPPQMHQVPQMSQMQEGPYQQLLNMLNQNNYSSQKETYNQFQNQSIVSFGSPPQRQEQFQGYMSQHQTMPQKPDANMQAAMLEWMRVQQLQQHQPQSHLSKSPQPYSGAPLHSTRFDQQRQQTSQPPNTLAHYKQLISYLETVNSGKNVSQMPPSVMQTPQRHNNVLNETGNLFEKGSVSRVPVYSDMHTPVKRVEKENKKVQKEEYFESKLQQMAEDIKQQQTVEIIKQKTPRKETDQKSNEDTQSEETLNNYESVDTKTDKPINSTQQTFEQLLETKLQQNDATTPTHSDNQPKKDFLKKSNPITESQNSNKSAKKYQYYADNFKGSQTASQPVDIPVSTPANQKKEMSSPRITFTQPKQSHVEPASVQRPAKEQENMAQRIQNAKSSKSAQKDRTVKRPGHGALVGKKDPAKTVREGVKKQIEVVRVVTDEKSCQIEDADLGKAAEKSAVEEQWKLEELKVQLLEEHDQKLNSIKMEKEDLTKEIEIQKKELAREKETLEFTRIEQEEIIRKLQEDQAQITGVSQKEDEKLKQREEFIEKEREKLTAERDRLNKDKKAFKTLQDNFKIQQETLEKEKETFKREKTKNESEKGIEISRLNQKVSKLEEENKKLKKKPATSVVEIQTDIEESPRISISEAVLSPIKEMSPVKEKSPVKKDSPIKEKCPQKSPMKEEVKFEVCERKDIPLDTTFEKQQESDEGTIEPEEILSDEEQKEDDLKQELTIEEEEDEFDMKFYPQYHNQTGDPKLVDEIKSQDGKVQRIYSNGKKEVNFNNGVKREVFPDGYSIVYFMNKDIKQTYPDGKIVYFFSDAETTQTTFPNGLQVFKFSNRQIEKHFVDGTKEISFPDGTIKCLFPDGEEESIFPDGTIQKVEKNGNKVIEFPSGQRDIIYQDGSKVREYPDGTVKKFLANGNSESIKKKPRGGVKARP